MPQNFEVRVISLPQQQHRRAQMAQVLEQAVTWQFQEAIAGKDLALDLPFYDRVRRLQVFGYDMRINEIACFLSHRAVWKACAAAEQSFLVLEDDVQLGAGVASQDVQAVLNLLVERMGERLFVRLGNSKIRQDKTLRATLCEPFALYRYHRDPLGAFAYMLSPQVAEKLLAASAHVFTPVDDFMWRGWEHGCMLHDVSPDFFFTQEEGNPSTIGDRAKPHIALLKKIPREWHRFLDTRKKKAYERQALAQK